MVNEETGNTGGLPKVSPGERSFYETLARHDDLDKVAASLVAWVIEANSEPSDSFFNRNKTLKTADELLHITTRLALRVGLRLGEEWPTPDAIVTDVKELAGSKKIRFKL